MQFDGEDSIPFTNGLRIFFGEADLHWEDTAGGLLQLQRSSVCIGGGVVAIVNETRKVRRSHWRGKEGKGGEGRPSVCMKGNTLERKMQEEDFRVKWCSCDVSKRKKHQILNFLWCTHLSYIYNSMEVNHKEKATKWASSRETMTGILVFARSCSLHSGVRLRPPWASFLGCATWILSWRSEPKSLSLCYCPSPPWHLSSPEEPFLIPWESLSLPPSSTHTSGWYPLGCSACIYPGDKSMVKIVSWPAVYTSLLCAATTRHELMAPLSQARPFPVGRSAGSLCPSLMGDSVLSCSSLCWAGVSMLPPCPISPNEAGSSLKQKGKHVSMYLQRDEFKIICISIPANW